MIKIKPFTTLLVLIWLFASCTKNGIPAAKSLTISEGFENPIGFYDAKPTFSWKLPVDPKIKSQSAYQIVAASSSDVLPDNPDLWDSGKRDSHQSIFVDYEGSPLKSRQKVFWQVKYWNQEGEASEWSTIQNFELGLLNNSDWQAKWIGLPLKSKADTTQFGTALQSPRYLRKEFTISSDIKYARLYVTAKGVFDAHLNGKDISNDVMPPGWTPKKQRLETLTYDVTNLLQKDGNTLAFELAVGWHAGRLGWQKNFWNKGEDPKVLAQLEVTLKDGTTQIINTDESWRATNQGPLRFSEIYDGEVYNANLEMPNWSTTDFDDSTWAKVKVTSIDTNIKLEPKRQFTVKQKQIVPTKEIIQSEGLPIFDLKQNMVGVPLLKVPMKKGDTLKIRFAEMLAPDGSFYTKNYRSAHSTDYYVSNKDGGIEWSPKFTFHGFRYVELSGFDTSKTPNKDWVTGLVQYSDFDARGSFSSSHEKLNQLQSNITWGLKGNFFDVPTDCPQRDERLGWTGDAQVIAPASIFNLDMHAFWASWLQSLREEQFENGGIPFVVPDVLENNAVSSGWGDACAVIPWDIYQRTGDKEILEENFDMMQKWVAHHLSKTEDYISAMNTFGDWLQPYSIKPDGTEEKRGQTPKELIGTAYFAHSTALTMKTAEVLNKETEKDELQQLHSKIRAAFEDRFFDADGKMKDGNGTQTGYLLALSFDLLSEATAKKAIPHLIEKISEADNHLRTGFLGTPLLPRVLEQIGETELMYSILFKETYPSWFYSINQGATTMWERWNSYSKTEGFNKERMNSLNHYAYGAIGEFMYERIAGIAPLEIGYKKIKIAPVIGGPLTSAKGSYDSPYGRIESSWKLENGIFSLNTTIPPNTTAVVEIPSKKNGDIQLNGKVLTDSNGVKIIGSNEGYTEIEVQPGVFSFQSKLQK